MARIVVDSIELETVSRLLESTASRIKEVDVFTRTERSYLRDIIAESEELETYTEKIFTLEMIVNSLIRYGKVLERDTYLLKPELKEILEKEGKIVKW